MQIKYLKHIIEAQGIEFRIVGVAWAPNGKKLAVATCDRQMLLFDENGEKRDRFGTKPSDVEAGKRSYVIKGIAFSPDSAKIAVAQSDSIVYVYKIGEKWGEKKAICNKFLQPCPVTSMIWLHSGPIICGLLDGKVRLLQTKSNKSHSLYSSDSLVVALAPNASGTGFVSGHMDCSIIRFYISGQEDEAPQGRLCTHSVPPYALSWPQASAVFAAGCDKRVVVYNNSGRIAKQFDYTKDTEDGDLTTACCSPSGQAVAIGGYDNIRIFAWNSSAALWEESQTKRIPHMYSVTSLAWSRDGSRIACASHSGFCCLFESVLRRTVWKDQLEITYVGPTQVLVRQLADEGSTLILQSDHGKEIEDLKVMGREGFIVARTARTLLVADTTRGLMSEVPWSNTTKLERFYFDTPGVCLVVNAGELSVIEIGGGGILASVRTEFANPHLLSVRLSERNNDQNARRLAYLVDLKTIAIEDLVHNVGVCQIAHESKIDWLELSETCQKLLFRDVKQRLLLVDVATAAKMCIFSGVTFAQWVEGSDVAIAQAGTSLAVWYNIDLPDRPTILNVRGDVFDVVRHMGKTQVHSADSDINVTLDLDEALVEFGTAVHDCDFGRAVLFLETIGDAPEADAMWWNLTTIAHKKQDVYLLDRCYAALGNIAKVFCIEEITQDMERNDDGDDRNVWAKVAVLNGDLQTAENIYMEQGNVEATLAMYKKLHKWDEAIEVAAKRGYEHVDELRDEYMRLLLNTNRFEKAASILEAQGHHERALSLYLKANKFVRVANTLLAHDDLMTDANLVSQVLQQLVKQELFDHAAEIYAGLQNLPMAMECYRKGKAWSKAVELARSISPDRVVALEEEWGDHLVAGKHADAAINHYIEAGCTLKALDAAIGARQWKKAIHIVQAVEEHESLVTYCGTLGEHLAKVKDYPTAEAMFLRAHMYKEVVQMYNEAGQWDKAHRIASQHLDADQVADMYMRQAEHLEAEGKYRDAEKLYLAVSAPDLAIAMYKRIEQYDSMLRLVERFHPDLLTTTHSHLGQQMEAQGKQKAAEVHFLAAGDWKSAMNMYRTAGMWEEAYRVAKQHGGTTATNQVAYLWARTLPVDSAIKLLAKLGILEACVDYACETFQYEFAFQLCRNLEAKKVDVHYSYAMALEDDGKFGQAEAEFILAGKPKEAVLMYTHANDWQNAIRVADINDPKSVVDVLKAQAMQRFQEKNFNEFEALLLRAQAPDLIVNTYRTSGMWTDALRICKDYLPNQVQSLQTEYASVQGHTGNPHLSIEMILTRANELAMAGQHKQSVEWLMQVKSHIADKDIEKRALARAADMVHKFLFGSEADELTRELATRLRNLGEYLAAAQLFISADRLQEAIDCFISAEDWTSARKIAKELDPQLVNYVEGKHKERLTKAGNIEQLADVDMMGALELLAAQGQWVRCIEKAKTFGGNVLQKYVAQYASFLLKDAFTMEALDLFITHSTPATPQNFNIYNRIAFNMFAMSNVSDADSYGTWMRLRRMLLDLANGLAVTTTPIDSKIRTHFETLLLIAHLYAVRCVCRQVQMLKGIGAKISVALLRYTDIIPADKAFYEAGMDLRAEARNSEAFVFLNHYLDICEAIEDDESPLIDHTDFGRTDFPSNVPIPEQLYLQQERDEHDRVREWVLAVSMDQKVDQELPLDARRLYESSLESGQSACILTGYPLRDPIVTFVHSERAANKDMWTKLMMAGKMYPDSHIADLLSFINEWCGAATAL